MAFFQNEQEIYEVLGGFFEKIRETDAAKELMDAYRDEIDEAYDAPVRFIFRNPSGQITWVRGEDGLLDSIYGDTDRTAELTFEMNADVANLFWQGELDLTQAMARQQMTATGPLSKALKVAPKMEAFYPMYREYLKEIKREDLIA